MKTTKHQKWSEEEVRGNGKKLFRNAQERDFKASVQQVFVSEDIAGKAQ